MPFWLKLPPGFAWHTQGSDTLLVREHLVEEVGVRLQEFLAGRLRGPSRPLAGGRGDAVVVHLANGLPAVFRRNLRGGVPGRFLRDLYIGTRYRPFREVVAVERLRQRGVLVPESLGAVVQRVGRFLYRGAVAMREVSGSMNLWQYLQRAPHDEGRRVACTAAIEAVEALHAAGAVHPDLNLTNFLVVDQGPQLQAWVIDCDGVRFVRVAARHVRRARRRLQRSAHKLDPRGAFVEPSWFDALED